MNKKRTLQASIADPADRLTAARGVLAELQAVASAPGRETRISLGLQEIDARLAGGLQAGGLHEIFAAGIGDEAAASGFVAGLAACAIRTRHRPILWIDTSATRAEDGLLWPPGLADWGMPPDSLIRATPRHPRDALRIADDALSIRALGAVVVEIRGPAATLDLTAFRRLHLAAESRSVACFLLRFGAEPIASPALTRWSVAARPSGGDNRRLVGHSRLDADLTRQRGGGLGSWCVEWSADAKCFVSVTRPERQPLPQPAVSAVFDRSDQPGLAARAG